MDREDGETPERDENLGIPRHNSQNWELRSQQSHSYFSMNAGRPVEPGVSKSVYNCTWYHHNDFSSSITVGVVELGQRAGVRNTVTVCNHVTCLVAIESEFPSIVTTK